MRTLTLISLLALSLGISSCAKQVTTKALKAPVYTSYDGWQIALVVEEGWTDSVVCEVRDLRDCRLHIWKDSKMIVTLSSGQEVRSLGILAFADAMQTTIVDNRKAPFVVTANSIYGRRGPPQLFIKLDRRVKPGTVGSIWFEGIVSRCQ